MTYKKIIDEILLRAEEVFEDAEVFLSINKSTSIQIFEGEISQYKLAEGGGLSLRGLYDGKMGYSYTEKICLESIDMLIEEALENSKYTDGDRDYIHESKYDYPSLKEQNLLENVNISEKIRLLKEIETKALSLDKRTKTNRLIYNESYNKRYIYNTKGLNLSDSKMSGGLYFSVIVKDGEDVKTGSSSRLIKDFKELDPDEIGVEAVKNAVDMLGASSIESGNYNIIFENDTFASLLASFGSVFTAESVQKGMSLLEGKLNKRIGSDRVNIIDDPFIEGGFGNKYFDDEGSKTQLNIIVENGILKKFLYTWKSALKDGVKSTGNAGRSYKGTISTSVNNLYLKPGEKTEEDLLSLVKEGIYIDSLQGLHSGLDPVSGDFSLSASGYQIKDKTLYRPINQITVSANFFDLFENIIGIANNLDFSLASGGKIGSPSVAIKNLSISGK